MSVANEKGEIQFVEERPESVDASKPHQIVQIDNIQVLGLDPDNAEFYMNYSPEKRKKIIHKVRIADYVHGLSSDLSRLTSVLYQC